MQKSRGAQGCTFNGVSSFGISIHGEGMGVVRRDDHERILSIRHFQRFLHGLVKGHNLLQGYMSQVVVMSMVNPGNEKLEIKSRKEPRLRTNQVQFHL